MMSPSLVAMLEAVTEGDATLDRSIALAFLAPITRDWYADVRPYTTSLDAALTLLPNGVDYLLGKGRLSEDEKQFGCIVFDPSAAAKDHYDEDDEMATGEHEHSLAIAVCIAGLKTRMKGTMPSACPPAPTSDDAAIANVEAEIEVTDEMIEAGRQELAGYSREMDHPSEVVWRIYEAMRKVADRGSEGVPR
jgi:hypothetical protein